MTERARCDIARLVSRPERWGESDSVSELEQVGRLVAGHVLRRDQDPRAEHRQGRVWHRTPVPFEKVNGAVAREVALHYRASYVDAFMTGHLIHTWRGWRKYRVWRALWKQLAS